MRTHSNIHLERKEWVLFLIPSVTLLVYLFYTLSFVYFIPYPGFVFNSGEDGWFVTDSSQPQLSVGDVLVSFGDLSFNEYEADRLKVPLADIAPNEEIPIKFLNENRSLTIRMITPTVNDRLKRTLSTIGFFPFWIAGTVVLLFLRPRDRRWLLLLTFMYLIAIWVTVGAVSSWRLGASRLILGATFWLMAPVFIHLHLIVPTSISPKTINQFMSVIYLIAIVCSILEFFQVLPTDAPLLGALFGIFGSIALLVYRLVAAPQKSAERLSTQLMLAGIGLAFAPGILYEVVPSALSLTPSTTLGLSISQLAIPILPFFYVYAVYKRQLGALEFRTNRLIAIYSFALLYPPLFLLLVVSGNSWIESASDRTVYLLIISTAFVIATPPLLARFQLWVNRLAYGTTYDPEDLIRIFANRVPSGLDRANLIDLIKSDILPSLLIRQSCLLLLEDQKIVGQLFEQQLGQQETAVMHKNLQEIMRLSGLYRPPLVDTYEPKDWIRLAILLKVRNEVKGLWLFGKRDPDDFYPQTDVELLNTLANQVAPVIESIQLYEALQQHAKGLAVEVADRTAELRSEKDRTQAILDSAGEGIFFTDPQGIILYANPKMNNLTGFTAVELLGTPLNNIQTDESSAEAARQMLLALENGERWTGNLTLQRKDGDYYDANLTIAPIYTDDQRIDGFVGVQSDVSKFKEIDRLKSEIIANVSHELRTPLTNIRMYIQLLKIGKPEKQDHYFEVLHHETERLTRLIEDLLELSKLDSGEISTNLEPTDIQLVIKGVVESNQAKADEKNINLMVENNTPQLPLALADPMQINQVFNNLVINAINYIPSERDIVIHFGTGTLVDHPAVWVSVADNGQGINPEEIPHLFERFYRGEIGQASKVAGTGLGLAISQEIVDRHHGKIEVASEVGVGTTFTVWLPIAK